MEKLKIVGFYLYSVHCVDRKVITLLFDDENGYYFFVDGKIVKDLLGSDDENWKKYDIDDNIIHIYDTCMESGIISSTEEIGYNNFYFLTENPQEFIDFVRSLIKKHYHTPEGKYYCPDPVE
jgi:hypothetical protein